MQKTSMLLLRTQSTLRIIELSDELQQQRLKHVAVGLGLIERILIAVIDAPESEFENAVLGILDESLTAALTAIDELTE